MVFNYWVIYAAILLTINYFSGFLFVAVGPLFFSLISDSWSLSFFILLFVVSSRVLSWSYYYIDREEYYARFILIVISFVSSIIILIFIGRLVGALIGWDGLGGASFLRAEKILRDLSIKVSVSFILGICVNYNLEKIS